MSWIKIEPRFTQSGNYNEVSAIDLCNIYTGPRQTESLITRLETISWISYTNPPFWNIIYPPFWNTDVIFLMLFTWFR